jgi:hypothetical protein
MKLHFIQIALFCSYALLPATVKVLETFLEAILWKPFQLLNRILSDVSRITKSSVLSMLVAFQGTGKNQLEPGQESMGNAAVLSRSYL